jgi:hypothetical protein
MPLLAMQLGCAADMVAKRVVAPQREEPQRNKPIVRLVYTQFFGFTRWTGFQ